MFKFFIFFVVYFFICELDHCVSKPLFLTPLIENGEIRAAQRKAKVRPFLPKVKSYSGYLTVDKEYNSNVFFWFFPKISNWTDAPLLLWLDGGPGCSSLLSMFSANGPYVFKKNVLQKRLQTWTNFFNLLYVDVPVGTGFSFSDSYRGYGGNLSEVGAHVIEVLRQFLLLFPTLQKNKLILCSLSYGSKHATIVAYTILTKSTIPKTNIWKIFMGSPWLSPEDMLPHFSSYFAAHGIVDGQGHDVLRQHENLMFSYLKAKEWDGAHDLWNKLHLGDSLVHNLTGLSNKFNLLRGNQPFNLPLYIEAFANKNETKAALHVHDEINFVIHNKSISNTQKDFMESIKSEFGIVLDNYRTLTYFGQFDIATPYPLHGKVMEHMDWSGNWDYTQAHRSILRWKQRLCGYYTTAKNYTEVMIRNAGHLVGDDSPHCTLGLLLKFINGDLD